MLSEDSVLNPEATQVEKRSGKEKTFTFNCSTLFVESESLNKSISQENGKEKQMKTNLHLCKTEKKYVSATDKLLFTVCHI